MAETPYIFNIQNFQRTTAMVSDHDFLQGMSLTLYVVPQPGESHYYKD